MTHHRPTPVIFKALRSPFASHHSSFSATAQTEVQLESLLLEREMAEETAKKKAWSLKKAVAAMSGGGGREGRPWKLPGIKWKGGKRRSLSVGFQVAVIDGVVFRIVSVVEGVVLVSTLCFFYICCGCHF